MIYKPNQTVIIVELILNLQTNWNNNSGLQILNSKTKEIRKTKIIDTANIYNKI